MRRCAVRWALQLLPLWQHGDEMPQVQRGCWGMQLLLPLLPAPALPQPEELQHCEASIRWWLVFSNGGILHGKGHSALKRRCAPSTTTLPVHAARWPQSAPVRPGALTAAVLTSACVVATACYGSLGQHCFMAPCEGTSR